MQGKAQAGVTWQSEVRFQEQAGHPIEGVAIPDAQNTTARYGGAIVKGAPHPEAARRCFEFIREPAGRAIFGSYGYTPYYGDRESVVLGKWVSVRVDHGGGGTMTKKKTRHKKDI